jgi:general secretion pathway protein J
MKCSHRNCSAGHADGFTLLEMLVALMLLGLISAMALGGVRLGARTWETVTARTGDNGRVQMVRFFLARELAQAVPVYAGDQTGEPQLAYQGDGESLIFVAPLAPHFGLGGFQRLELSIADADTGGGEELVMKRRRFQATDRLDESSDEDETHILLQGIEEARFAYRGGAASDSPGWSDEWRDRKSLPALVRLQVRFADGRRAAWPDLLVARRINTPPGCLAAQADATCRRR